MSGSHVEYERRFIVDDKRIIPDSDSGTLIVQGYLSIRNGSCFRVRRAYQRGSDGAFYELTPTAAFKGRRQAGARLEDEIFVEEFETATDLLRKAEWRIVKIRHEIVDADTTWEVDVFLWENEGLVIAECEGSDFMDHVTPPEWCGAEITADLRYNNENLAVSPYTSWEE